MTEYELLLKDPRWKDLRDSIIERDGGRCRYCEADERLHVHHTRYGATPWQCGGSFLLTLCEICHERIHTRGSSFNYRLVFKYESEDQIKELQEIAWRIGDRHNLAEGFGWGGRPN
jgi:hypothetical protein